jgi:hypothetical protein
MKIEIITNERGNPIGWDIIPETAEDNDTIATMRDLQFFGFDDSAIKYDGMRMVDDSVGKEFGNIERLCFKQKKHTRAENQLVVGK